MMRIAALALVVDGVWQIAGQAALWPTLADRSGSDQAMFAAHLAAGLALAAAAALVNARTPPTPAARRLTMAALAGALVIALIETTWFNWTGTVIRGMYTVAISAMCVRARVR